MNKEASKYYSILLLAGLIGGGAYWITKSVELAIIVGAITIMLLWLKVLTDDIGRVKKKLKMEDV